MMATISKRMRIASGKIYWREILACLLLLIGIYFLRQQKHEISSIASYFHQAKSFYLLVAGAFTLLFVVLQSAMYRHSFAAIDIRFKWRYAIELFLKRNLIAVFLPGGGVSALAYIPAGIRKAVGSRPSIHRASGLFAFAGILSTFLVCLPVLFTSAGMGHWKQTLGGLVLILALLLLVLSLRNSLRS